MKKQIKAVIKRTLQLTIPLFALIVTFQPKIGYSWDGFDYEKGSYVSIESGNLVRRGNDIEIFDYNTGEYKTVEVQNVNSQTVEVYDYDADEYRDFDMD